MSAQDEWKIQDAFREKGRIIEGLREDLAKRDNLLAVILAILEDEGTPTATRVISVAELLRAQSTGRQT